MKSSTICMLLLCAALSLQAQPKTVANLPPGQYIILLKQEGGQWTRGNIILINENRYRLTAEDEEGAYRISITAQRIFFTSGPLRGFFARLMLHSGQPAIELPQAENGGQQGIAAGVIAVWKPAHQ